MIERIAPSLLGRLTGWLPGWILRRFFPPSSLARELKIDFRANEPGRFTTGTAIPVLELWLQVTNLSNYPVVLETIVLDIWAEQPVAKDLHIERPEIPPRSNHVSLHFSMFLSDPQLRYLGEQAGDRGVLRALSINYRVQASSKLGPFRVERQIERRDFPCHCSVLTAPRLLQQ